MEYDLNRKKQIYGIVKHIKTLKQNEFELKKLKFELVVKGYIQKGVKNDPSVLLVLISYIIMFCTMSPSPNLSPPSLLYFI